MKDGQRSLNVKVNVNLNPANTKLMMNMDGDPSLTTRTRTVRVPRKETPQAEKWNWISRLPTHTFQIGRPNSSLLTTNLERYDNIMKQNYFREVEDIEEDYVPKRTRKPKKLEITTTSKSIPQTEGRKRKRESRTSDRSPFKKSRSVREDSHHHPKHSSTSKKHSRSEGHPAHPEQVTPFKVPHRVNPKSTRSPNKVQKRTEEVPPPSITPHHTFAGCTPAARTYYRLKQTTKPPSHSTIKSSIDPDNPLQRTVIPSTYPEPQSPKGPSTTPSEPSFDYFANFLQMQFPVPINANSTKDIETQCPPQLKPTHDDIPVEPIEVNPKSLCPSQPAGIPPENASKVQEEHPHVGTTVFSCTCSSCASHESQFTLRKAKEIIGELMQENEFLHHKVQELQDLLKKCADQH